MGYVGHGHTPMAPEQARGLSDVDARADVFALGVVLFRCLTGRKPFTGDDMVTVLLKLVLEDPPRLRDLNPDVPPALDALVARMLAKIARREAGGPDALLAELELARNRLVARSAAIRDETLRAGFLERVPENARTLELWSATKR